MKCAACQQPIEAMEPHMRYARLDQTGRAIKGSFVAYCIPCARAKA